MTIPELRYRQQIDFAEVMTPRVIRNSRRGTRFSNSRKTILRVWKQRSFFSAYTFQIWNLSAG